MNSFKRRAEKHRIEGEMLIVRRKFGNIKPIVRQTLINIGSMSWEEVTQETIIKTLKFLVFMAKIIVLF